jgi:outer membrane biosynthesis protein TonB
VDAGTASRAAESHGPNNYVIWIATILALSLASGIGIYFWWRQAPVQPVAKVAPEPVTPVVPAPVNIPVAAEEPVLMSPQKDSSLSGPATTQSEKPVKRPAGRNPPVSTSQPKSSKELPQVVQESSPQKQAVPPAGSASSQHQAYAGVDQAVARECASKGGLAYTLCKERVRFSICSNRWGTTSDCPNYEHKDVLGF